MTTLPRLLNKFSILTLFATLGAQGATYCPKTFEVLERTKGEKYEMVPRQLESLFCNDTFEGEHFKIVFGTENEALSFSEPRSDLLTKAANVYHHLTIARNFWIEVMKSKYVQEMGQITIRLEIPQAFSSSRHFKNPNQEVINNNAWTVPEGHTPRGVPGEHSWGKEIWYSPMKKIDIKKQLSSKGANPVYQGLKILQEPLVTYNISSMIYQSLSYAAQKRAPDSTFIRDAIVKVGSIAILFTMEGITKHIDKWFMERWFYVDTAMVPEISYHEFSHVALSDTMKTVHSVPVIEGVADYYATRIADRRKMYSNLKDYALNKPRDRENKAYYNPLLEAEWNASDDFTLGLLWKAKTAFDEENTKRQKSGHKPLADFDQLLFSAHYDLDENSNIATGLNGALLKACHESCTSVLPGTNLLHQVFEKKGFN